MKETSVFQIINFLLGKKVALFIWHYWDCRLHWPISLKWGLKNVNSNGRVVKYTHLRVTYLEKVYLDRVKVIRLTLTQKHN